MTTTELLEKLRELQRHEAAMYSRPTYLETYTEAIRVIEAGAKDTARLDWLAEHCDAIEADARVTASDGLPAAIDWVWDRYEEPLRDAIDSALGER